MDTYFYVGALIFLVLGFILARKDVRTGLIPDNYTNTGIIFAVVMNFFAFGFFSFKFYLYFTILVLLYLFFMYLQRAMHSAKLSLGTGDVKYFLLIYALIAFHSFAFAGIPLLNIIFWTIVLMFAMMFYRLAYYMLLSKVKVFRIMYGSSIEKSTLRLAPLIYLSFVFVVLTLIL
jgi:hypothetical protein